MERVADTSLASSSAAAASAGIAAPSSRAVHLENWDRLRVIAALDMVSLHLAGTHALFGFGLPLFLMLSVALGVAKPEAPPTARFVQRRFDRIIVPWLGWSAVLTAVRVIESLVAGQAAFSWVEWPMALYGPRIHLWFLPYIALLGIVAHFVHKRTRGWSPTGSAALALIVGVVLFAVPPRVEFVWPFDQWTFSVPALFLGYALGRAVAAEPDLARLRVLVTAGYALFGVLAGAIVLASPVSGPLALRYAGGLGLLVAATWLPNRSGRFTKELAPLMLGVYILHPTVWLLAVRPLVNVCGVGSVEWIRVVIGFPLTMLVVWGLRRTWLRRVL